MTSGVVFQKLILEGFGPYRKATVFHFEPGINTYVAPNESGKTSMAAGLVATLFGLAQRQRSASGFTLARLRNRYQPAACRSALLFLSAGRSYLLQRNFDTHDVVIWEVEADERRQLFAGQHNPQALRPLEGYDTLLQDLLGISSRELFEEVYFVAQPLPEVDRISAQIQSLLAGGKSVAFQDALERLVEQLKALTKFVGPNDRGISARNLTNDGELERLDQVIRRKKEQIDLSQESSERLLGVQQALLTCEAELTDLKTVYAQHEKTQKAWSNWQMLAQRYQAARKERRRLAEAVKQGEGLASELTSLQKILQTQYTPFHEADGEDLATPLHQLIHCRQQIQESKNRYQELIKQGRQTDQALEQVAASMGAGISWQKLGTDPVDKLRTVRGFAADCLAVWQQVTVSRSQLAAVRRTLLKDYRLLEEADETDLALLADHKAIASRLALEENEARTAFEAIQHRWQAVKSAQEQHKQDHAAVMELGPDAARFAREKKQLLEKQDLLRENLAASKRLTASRIFFQLLVAAPLASAVFFLIGADRWPWALTGSLISLVLGYLAADALRQRLPGRFKQNRDRLLAEQEAVNQELSALNQKLGSFASVEGPTLVDLIQRLDTRDKALAELIAEQEKLDQADLVRLEGAFRSRQAAVVAHAAALAPYASHHPDLTQAYKDWQALHHAATRLESDLQQLLSSQLHSTDAQVDGVDPSKQGQGQWQQTASFMRVLLDPPPQPTVVGLIERLSALTENWWQEQEREAEAFIQRREEMARLTHEQRVSLDALEQEHGRLLKLQQEESNLLILLDAPLASQEDDPQKTLAAYQRFQDEKASARQKEAALRLLLDSWQVSDLDRLKDRLETSADETHGWMTQWQEHINRFPGLPPVDQAQDLLHSQQQTDQLDEAVRVAAEQMDKAQEKRDSLMRELARLEGIDPINIAAAELEWQALCLAQKQAEQKADALTLAYKALKHTIAAYSHTYQERLAEKASLSFQSLSHNDRRQIRFDDQLNIAVLDQGTPVPLESLSKGTRDQLYLALRLAIADALSEEIRLPIVLDDPLQSSDSHRIRHFRALIAAQQGRQFILLSHAIQYEDWGRSIAIERAGAADLSHLQ